MSKKATPRNSPCPCGSGKKYKNCCYQKDYEEKPAERVTALLTDEETGAKRPRNLTAIDSLPTHNKNGLRPEITKEQMMDLCLDEIYRILQSEQVGMMADLVNRVIKEMNVVPTFTYREIAERMHDKDQRFEIYQYQICSLKGTDPIDLMLDKFDDQQ